MRSFSLSTLALSVLSLYSSTTFALPITQPAPALQSKSSPESAQAVAPVVSQDFPDPSYIQTSNGIYAFATADRGYHIQMATTSSFNNPTWTLLNQDALPSPGPWTDGSFNTWAPNVAQIASNKFVMYYAAPTSQDNTKHCVGTATASTVTGPYSPSSSPFVCDLSVGGQIDPSFFKDPVSGKTYVVYKVDGNSLGNNSPTPIMLQQVNAADGITKIGSPVTLLNKDSTDGPLVEAPTMMYANGVYFLLFSSHYYNTADYDLRYVSASSITGPYSSPQQTLLKTNDGNGITAPGSGDIHQDGSIVFHGTTSYSPLVRPMYAGHVSASGTTLKYTGSV